MMLLGMIDATLALMRVVQQMMHEMQSILVSRSAVP